MPLDARVLLAAMNNAEWCDTTCRACGIPGAFHDAYWIHPGDVPPYTSKFITLAGAEAASAQRDAIRELAESLGESGFSVKDSFQCLDLAPQGFTELFRAHWIHREAISAPPRDASEMLQWSVVHDESRFHDWEHAWRGCPENALARQSPTAFRPSLIGEPGVHLLAGSLGERVVATAVLNRTGDVVGLSNVFSGVEGVGPRFPGCIRLAHELYPDLPLVGYERGEALVNAEQAGFTRLSGLTVWQRSAS